MQLDLLSTDVEGGVSNVKLSRSESALLRFLEQQPLATSSRLQRELGVVNVSAVVSGLNRKLADAEDRRRVACGTWFPDGVAVRGWRVVEMPAA
jgi:hypothetical protein